MEAVSEGPAYRQELLRFLAGELRPRSCQGRPPAEAVGLFFQLDFYPDGNS